MRLQIIKIIAFIACFTFLLSLLPFSITVSLASENLSIDEKEHTEINSVKFGENEITEIKNGIYYKLKFISESKLENINISIYNSADELIAENQTNKKGVYLIKKLAQEDIYFKIDEGKKRYRIVFPEDEINKPVKYTYENVRVDQNSSEYETFFVSVKKMSIGENVNLDNQELPEENNDVTDDFIGQGQENSIEQENDSTDESLGQENSLEDDTDSTEENQENSGDEEQGNLNSLDKESLLELIEQILADKQEDNNNDVENDEDQSNNHDNNESPNDESDNQLDDSTNNDYENNKQTNDDTTEKELKSKITIHVASKTNEDIPVVGATVALVNAVNKATIDEVVTDDSGNACFNVEAGSYSAQIVEPAKGYCNSDASINITVDEDGSISGESTLYLTAQGSVVLTAIDSVTGGIVQNVKLVINDEQGDQIYSGTTDDKGKVVVPINNFGEFNVQVSAVPADYDLNTQEQSFFVEEGFIVSGDTEILIDPKEESVYASADYDLTSLSPTGVNDSNTSTTLSGEGVPQTGVSDHTLLLVFAAIALICIAIVAKKKERTLYAQKEEELQEKN